MENLNTAINGLHYEDLDREDIASNNLIIAVLAYAAFFGKREFDTAPFYRRSEKERMEIYNKYKTEIETFLRNCDRVSFDCQTYNIRKAQLRGIFSICDRKGTAVNDMPIFKHIDLRIAAFSK